MFLKCVFFKPNVLYYLNLQNLPFFSAAIHLRFTMNLLLKTVICGDFLQNLCYIVLYVRSAFEVCSMYISFHYQFTFKNTFTETHTQKQRGRLHLSLEGIYILTCYITFF